GRGRGGRRGIRRRRQWRRRPRRCSIVEMGAAFEDDTWTWDVPSGTVSTARAGELAALVHADDRPRLAAVLDEVRAGKRDRFQIELRVLRPGNRSGLALVRGAVTARDA